MQTMQDLGMNYIMMALGILLVLTAIYDLTYTTLAPKGAGQITSRVTSFTWKICLKLSGYNGESRILSNLGYIFLLFILLIWILMIWFGNTLIIYSDYSALVDQDKRYVTSFIDKAYYMGYVLSTMGSGEYQPTNQFWKMYAAINSFTGLAFITIALSYLIPVVNAVAEKRALANYIAGLGNNPYEILENAYNGKDFKNLEAHFDYLNSQILKLNKNHQAYPALHYFHEDKFIDSSCINLSSLDEVLSIFLCAVDDKKRPDNNYLMPLRHAMTLFFQTLHGAYLNPKDVNPEKPQLSRLPESLSRDVNREPFTEAFDNLGKRRRIILAYLEHHGWTWDQMYRADYTLEFE